MIWTLLAWIGFGLMVIYGWSAIALLRAASRSRLNMVWLVGAWQAVAALGAFLVWRSALIDTLTFGGIIGLLLVASSPVFWSLGKVGARLKLHGIRLGDVMMFR